MVVVVVLLETEFTQNFSNEVEKAFESEPSCIFQLDQSSGRGERKMKRDRSPLQSGNIHKYKELRVEKAPPRLYKVVNDEEEVAAVVVADSVGRASSDVSFGSASSRSFIEN